MLPIRDGIAGGAERHASRLGKHIMDGDAGLIAAAAVNPICLWCEGEFEPRKGGSPQRGSATRSTATPSTPLVVATPSTLSSAGS